MKSIFVKNITCLFFILYYQLCFGQTSITINSCDTTITEPAISFPAGNYELTVKSATNSKLSYNVEYFNSNYGNVYIYDGLNSSFHLIATLADPFNVPNQLFGGQTTGSAIMLKFYSAGFSSVQLQIQKVKTNK